jgi:hypothetical protein
MAALEMLILNVFLLGNEDHGRLLNSKGIGNSVVFLKMGSVVEIVVDRLDGG